jgi:hypothetical protein
MEAHRRADNATVGTTTTDAIGNFSLGISTGGMPFDGYLTLTKSDLVPARVYVSRPLTSSIQIGNVVLTSGATLNLLYGLFGQTVIPNQGTVVISVRDSTLSAVQVNQVSVTPQAGYLLYGDVNTGLPPSSLGTSGGSFWALNVSAGQTMINATSNGLTLGPAQITATEGQMTFVLLIADQVQPAPTVTPQTTDASSQTVGLAAVAISPPASVMNLGDVMDVSVSLTGPATTEISLYPLLYQALDNARYSPIDQSVFLFPQIKLPTGSTTVGFQMKYQNLSPPDNYVVSIVTADEASHVADLTQLPVTKFASFIIQSEVIPGSGPASTPPVAGSGLSTNAQTLTLALMPTSTHPGEAVMAYVKFAAPVAGDTPVGLQWMSQSQFEAAISRGEFPGFGSTVIMVPVGGDQGSTPFNAPPEIQAEPYIVFATTLDRVATAYAELMVYDPSYIAPGN